MFDNNSFSTESYSSESFLFELIEFIASIYRRFVVSSESRGAKIERERRGHIV